MASIEIQGIELGKSLSKILLSEKYKNYSIDECIAILVIARTKAQELLEKEKDNNGTL